jgi:hypothetical protein
MFLVLGHLSVVLGSWFLAIGSSLLVLAKEQRGKNQERRTKNEERRTNPSGWQNKMRLWRLVRPVGQFFISLFESDYYAVDKQAESRDFPKSVTFLNAFPKWNWEVIRDLSGRA